MNSGLLSSLIGVGGVVIGLLLFALLRMRSRIEKFSEVYFSKRIEAYEKMYEDYVTLTHIFFDISRVWLLWYSLHKEEPDTFIPLK